jgi:hypothetical protein
MLAEPIAIIRTRTIWSLDFSFDKRFLFLRKEAEELLETSTDHALQSHAAN